MRRALKTTFEKHPEFELLVLVERFLRKAVQIHDLSHIHELEEKLTGLVDARPVDGEYDVQLELIRALRSVLDAFNVASLAHKQQQRRSGEPFIVHPIHVALYEIYHELYEAHETNIPRIVASLLHDTIEETTLTSTQIEKQFGAPIRDVVERLTDNEQWKTWVKEGALSKLEEAALQFTKASQDVDALEVKIADRLDNLRTLASMPEERQTRKVLDTISVGYVEKAIQLHDWLFLRTVRESIDLYLTDDRLERAYGAASLAQWQELRSIERDEVVAALLKAEKEADA